MRVAAKIELAVEIVLVGCLVAFGLYLRLELVANKWILAGSDSYGYIQIANELRANLRFAFGPLPLEWYRRPLYPLFIALVKGAATTTKAGGDGWQRVQVAQSFVEATVLWSLAYAGARKIAGRIAAIVTLALAVSFPPSVLYTAAILTEPLAGCLALLAIVPLFWHADHFKAATIVAAIGAGLSTLLRPDGVVWVAALVPVLASRGWRARTLVVYATTFLVVVSPWFVRNAIRFHALHVADGMIDRNGEEMPHYRGFWSWMRTWAENEEAAGHPASCFYDDMCAPKIEMYAKLGAFDHAATSDEQQIVEQALEERAREGVSASVSSTFANLAAARRHAYPLRVGVVLPLERAVAPWLAPQLEVAKRAHLWPRFMLHTPRLKTCSELLFYGTLAATLVLLFTPALRMQGLMLFVPVLTRSVVLGWTGFSLARYVVPCYAACFVLIGAAIGVVTTGFERRLSRRYQ